MFKKRRSKKKSAAFEINALQKRSEPSNSESQKTNTETNTNTQINNIEPSLIKKPLIQENGLSNNSAHKTLIKNNNQLKDSDIGVVYKSGTSIRAEHQAMKEAIVASDQDNKRNKRKKGNRPGQKSAGRGIFAQVRKMNAAQHSNGIDYNPSICKDWHDAGYCVFGNSCIFLHDRSDYKAGWELDKDWDAEQRRKQERRRRRLQAGQDITVGDVSDSTDSEDLEDFEDDLEYGEISEKCEICDEEYTQPVRTMCNHVFCEACALSSYSTDKNCFKCAKPLNGVFNDGYSLLKKAKEERIAAQRLKNQKSQKSKLGEAPSYLRDIGRDAFKHKPKYAGGGEDDEAAIIVSQDEVNAAERRIELGLGGSGF